MFNWEKYGIEGADSSIVGDCQTQVNVYKPCIILIYNREFYIPTGVTVALWPLALPYIRFGLPYRGQ